MGELSLPWLRTGHSTKSDSIAQMDYEIRGIIQIDLGRSESINVDHGRFHCGHMFIRCTFNGFEIVGDRDIRTITD